MGKYYGDEVGGSLPADLEKTTSAAAASAASTSKDSYTVKLNMSLARNKVYTFLFKYKYQNPDTQEIMLSDSSPVWQETFAIPNYTKAVQNLTLTQGFKSYGVKFDLDPTSVQADVVIFESLTSNFATQTKVYDGTSTNVTIQTDGPTAFSPRWIKVRSRDNWEDLNISEITAGPITPLNSEVNTTIPPAIPTGVQVAAFNEISDPSNYTGYINASWTAPATGAKGYSVGIWESTPGVTLPSREFKVEGTSSRIDGLFVGKSYYVQVKSLSEFGTPSAWVSPTLNYPVVIPGNTAIPGAVTVSGVGTPRSIVLSWSVPVTDAQLVTAGGYYIAKIYANQFGTGAPLETKTCYSNSATFAGLTTGTQYWVTIQAYTGGATPVAGVLSSVYGPLVPIAVEPPDIQANFILANNQFQVGGTSGANDIHLSAYTKNVGVDPSTGLPVSTKGRIYIGGPETSGSAAVGLYNASGTPFYADNLGRFSLGDKLTWSGSALNVIGTIDVAGASTFSSYIISGATNSAFIGIGKQVPYRVSSVEQSGANGLTGIVINKSGAAVNSDYIKSDGSFRLGEGGLIYNGTQLNLIGNIQAIGGTFTGNLRVTTGSIISGTGTVAADGSVSGARIVLQQSGLYAHDGVAAGDVPTVSIIAATGSISATKGLIGGWDLQSTGLSSGGAKILNTGNISLGNNITNTLQSIVRLSADDPTYRLWIGSQTGSSANFSVTKEGKLYANGAQIDGTTTIGGTVASTVVSNSANALQANGTLTGNVSGTVNGVAVATVTSGAAYGAAAIRAGNGVGIDATSKYINTIDLNSSGISIKTAASGTRMQLTNAGLELFNDTTRNVFIDAATGTAEFRGTIYASAGEFAGKVTATSGRIGDWTIYSDGSIANGTTYFYGSSSSTNNPNGFAILDISKSAYFAGILVGSGGYQATSGNIITTTGSIIATGGTITAGLAKTSLYSDGTIYADTLGVYSGASALAIRQVQAAATGTNSQTGFLRVNASSQRFKKDIQYLEQGGYLDLVTRLAPASFIDINEDQYAPRAIGLIAEDVDKINEFTDALVPKDENGDPFAINYPIIGVISLMALKEIKTKIQAINDRLDNLGV